MRAGKLFALALLIPFWFGSCSPIPVFAYDPKARQIVTSTSNFNGNLSAADDTVQDALDTIDNLSVSGAPTSLSFVTTQAEAGLSAESNLGALTTGLLKISVSGGVATPSTAVAGTDYLSTSATTAAISDSLNKRYVTDAQLTVIGNTSGTNTGDQTSVSGNAGTATTLATARAIYGNNFDGSAALTQVIASTYGGTGNGFTKFSGPTTSEKTFTLPDASSTLLYSGGALGTPASGTLTNATGLPLAGVVDSTTEALGAGTIELGHESDTTLSRSAAGVLAVEGVALMKATSGVAATPSASQTDTITHGLGRTPTIIRIYGASSFINNASGIPVPASIGTYTASGNKCMFLRYDATTITAAEPWATTSSYAVRADTGVGNFVTGVIQNVGATTFDIAWTETGTATAQVYLWEAQ